MSLDQAQTRGWQKPNQPVQKETSQKDNGWKMPQKDHVQQVQTEPVNDEGWSMPQKTFNYPKEEERPNLRTIINKERGGQKQQSRGYK